MTAAYELEIWQRGLMVAAVNGPNFDTVHSEAMKYALQYAMDGPVEIRGIPADRFEQVSGEAGGITRGECRR